MNFNRRNLRINLENLEKDKKSLQAEFFNNQNITVLRLASVLIIVLNVFWSIFNAVTGNQMNLFSLEGIIGLAIQVIGSAFALIVSFRNGRRSSTLTRFAMLAFDICLIVGVCLLVIVRCKLIATSNSVLNGVTLSSYYLLILALMPFPYLVDTIVVGFAFTVATFIPQFVCSAGTYSLVENIILRICIIFTYVAFRKMTEINATLTIDFIRASYTDFLTKAMNRKALDEYVRSIDTDKVKQLGLLLFDIDDFKKYNDRFSHEKGDEVLKLVCSTVKEITDKEKATLFRYGGEEFVIVVKDATDDRLMKIGMHIKEAVEELKIERDDDTWRKNLTITVGCAMIKTSTEMEKDFISTADAQLYIGKAGTKNCVVYKGRIFISEGELTTAQKPTPYTDEVAHAVNVAIEKGEIQAFYQPLYDTATNMLSGAEALSRWVKSDGTIIMPANYIPELEKNSSILPLDWHMLNLVCKLLKYQKDNGIPQVRISVNFSRMHALYEQDFAQKLCAITDSYGIPHNLIEIEITESSYINLTTIIEPFIRSIRKEGFCVAVDDFGSGASSLGFVKSIDIDTLKIDRTLISSNCQDEKEKVLLESIIYLAQRLQLNSVAEGVETIEQLGFLKTLGCRQIQGFLFASPMPKNQFLDLCSDNKVKDPTLDPAALRTQSSSMKMLLDAVFTQYPLVCLANLTRNSYYLMSYDNFTSSGLPHSGLYTDMLETNTQSMHPEDRDVFNKTFNKDRLLQARKEGGDKIVLVTRQLGDDGQYHDIETCTHFVSDQNSTDVLIINLCRVLK